MIPILAASIESIDPRRWQTFGACRKADGRLFFHPPGERGSTRRRRDAAAKVVCASCPVLLLCREQALRVHEPYGVWGGMSEAEREVLWTRLDEDPVIAEAG